NKPKPRRFLRRSPVATPQTRDVFWRGQVSVPGAPIMHAASSGGTETTKAARRNLPLVDLVRRCGEAGGAQDEYRHELFRRAICELDEHAWQAVVDHFRGLVLANVKRHPWTAGRNEDEYWVNRVFERFWRAIGPDRFDS